MSAVVSNADLDAGRARGLLLGCCGARRWVSSVADGWPYSSSEALLWASEHAFDGLERADWMQAFASHARIGRPRADDERGASEQAGMRAATGQERDELETLNAEYERRFGHIFLVCATGLSSQELLAALRERLQNSPEAEFEIATREQRKITRLRLLDTFPV